MKFTVLINQAGIVDAGLADKTDWSDWAILEYVAEWQVHGSACISNGHVWLDYQHLMDEIPMLGIRTNGGISKRVTKLRNLGLLSTILVEGSRLFVKVTDLYCSVVRFRGLPSKRPGDSQIDCEDVSNTPLPAGNAPLPAGNAPLPAGNAPLPVGRLSNNQVINNQEQTKLLAGSRGNEKPGDGDVFDQALQWAQFFICECGYPLHIVQTAKTIPLFAEWVRLGYSVGLIRQAMAACHAWNNGRVPDSPMLYRKFLQSILDEQKRLADESAFSDRPGAGRIQAIDEWAKIPKADDDLWPWAKQHGYQGPGSKTYRQYRSFLHDEVEKRLRTRHREVAG